MCQDRLYYKLLLEKEQDPKLRHGPDVNSEDSSNHPPPYPWAFSEKGWKNDGLSLGEKGSHYHMSTLKLNYELIMHYIK